MSPFLRAPPHLDLAFMSSDRPGAAEAAAAVGPAASAGALPEWDLSDLYKATDDPAVSEDLDRAAAEGIDMVLVTDALGQVCLGPVVFSPKRLEMVFHRYLMLPAMVATT